MPRLMEKKDWMQTVAEVRSAENVWYENVSADGGFSQLAMPERGKYRVILVKVDTTDSTEKPRQKSARELIGYGRKLVFLFSFLFGVHAYALSWGNSTSDVFGTQTVNNVTWVFKFLDEDSVALSTSTHTYAPAVPKDMTIGSVVIPSVLGGRQVVALGPYAFQNCSLITSLSIPETVKGIYWSVFSGTESLHELEIPDTVEEIAGEAFFYDRGIETIKLPKNLKVIQSRTFIGCSNLKSVVWPEDYEEIGKSAFEYCRSLEEITIPASCILIGESAFDGVGAIKRINLSDENQYFGFSGGCLYRSSDKSIIVTLGSDELEVPDGAVSIPSYAFYEHSNLKKVFIPASVTALGYSCFGNCYGVETIVFHGTTPIGLPEAGFGKKVAIRYNPKYSDAWESVADSYGFSNVKPYEVVDPTNPDMILTNLVKGCYYVKGKFVGVSKEATSVVLPDGITEVTKNMLAGCCNLCEISIPLSVNMVEPGAFGDCADSLTINGSSKISFAEVSTVNGMPLTLFNAVSRGLEMNSAIASGLITPANAETVSIKNGIIQIGVIVEKSISLEKNQWEPIKKDVIEIDVSAKSGFYRFISKGK